MLKLLKATPFVHSIGVWQYLLIKLAWRHKIYSAVLNKLQRIHVFQKAIHEQVHIAKDNSIIRAFQSKMPDYHKLSTRVNKAKTDSMSVMSTRRISQCDYKHFQLNWTNWIKNKLTELEAPWMSDYEQWNLIEMLGWWKISLEGAAAFAGRDRAALWLHN